MSFGEIRIALPGAWDISNKAKLARALAPVYKIGDRVTLDLSEATSMDASSLGCLLRLKRSLVNRGTGAITLAGRTPSCDGSSQ
jgi:anti-anti-sigma regulatory factor